MKLTVLGSGDAFGSGGRDQTAFFVDNPGNGLLIDCGATVMGGIARAGIDPNAISTIAITHLHGDHFAGLVWFVMHARYVAQRTAPLTIVGPPGTAARLAAVRELLYTGSERQPLPYDVHHVTTAVGETVTANGIAFTAFPARHPSGSVSTGLRMAVGGQTIAYSGDTAWHDAIPACADNADLFICECYARRAGIPNHLDWDTLSANFDRLTARQILITHMNTEMIAASEALSAPRVTFAHDGMVVDIGAGG